MADDCFHEVVLNRDLIKYKLAVVPVGAFKARMLVDLAKTFCGRDVFYLFCPAIQRKTSQE